MSKKNRKMIYNIDLYRGIVSNSAGQTYDLEDVVQACELSIDQNAIKSATKTENKDTQSQMYTFKLKENEAEYGFNNLRLKISNRNYNPKDPYIVRLNNITKSVGSIKFANGAKKLILGVATFVVITGGIYLIANGLSDVILREDQARSEKQQEYFDKINEERFENGAPPLGVSDEEWQRQKQEALDEYYRENPYEYMTKDADGNIIFPYLNEGKSK